MPEFRISEHIEDYILNKNGEFLSDNAGFLSIEGASTKNPQNSAEKDFYKIYSNSDFMKKFDVIKEDHREFVNASKIKLTCKVIKKFIPYNGFYPSELFGELYTRFSSSYHSHVQYDAPAGAKTGSPSSLIRPFITPMFAPGIWNNMVKSGIAVDFPVYTGSFHIQRPASVNNITSYHLISTSSMIRQDTLSGDSIPDLSLAQRQLIQNEST